jgi:hypothetical protein
MRFAGVLPSAIVLCGAMINYKRILFICGSVNQTTMMMKIAEHLPMYECWFTPHYTDGLLGMLERNGLLEWTIVGKGHQQRAADLLRKHNLNIDFAGRQHDYDLVVTCSDLFLPSNIRKKRIVLVQEGMTDPETVMYHVVKLLRLPRYLASTSTFGLSHAYERMCVASEGYKKLFVRKGANPAKIVVTGIPNFDNCSSFVASTLPQASGYVLVATSDARETFKYENRRKTIEHAVRIAAGRKLVFKLHPNENVARATREIERYAPDAKVYHSCSIDALIADCDVLITKYSSCVYVGIALGKDVYSDFPMEELRRLCPIQNGGTSARAIADECVDLLSRPTCNVYPLKDVTVSRRAS